MPNLLRTFHILSMALIGAFTLVVSSYAVTVTTTKDVELDCCQDCPAHPVTYAEAGRSDTQLSVQVKGIRIDGEKELLAIMHGERAYMGWLRGKLKELGADTREKGRPWIKFYGSIEASMRARCASSSGSMTDMWDSSGRKMLTCPKGDGIVFWQFDPSCSKPGGDKQHGVYTITAVRDVEDDFVGSVESSLKGLGIGDRDDFKLPAPSVFVGSGLMDGGAGTGF